jgi:glycosyltransferase involved in cell wall biosynthesis
MSEPLVSIIIPSRNRIESLRQCIAHVKRQIHQNLEILAIDDCSDTPYELEADETVRLFKTAQNGGAGAARNVGLQHARGEYFCFLDDDDCWRPEKIAVQLETMRSREMFFGATEGYAVTDKSNRENSPIYHREYYKNFMMKHRGTTDLPATFDLPFLLSHNYIIASSVMIHRCVYERVGFFDDVLARWRVADYDYWKRTLAAGFLCCYIETPLVYYRAF